MTFQDTKMLPRGIEGVRNDPRYLVPMRFETTKALKGVQFIAAAFLETTKPPISSKCSIVVRRNSPLSYAFRGTDGCIDR